MEKAEEGDVSLLFLDASHFVMGCGFLGRIYGRTRRFVMTFSGRMRHNVLGAMDYVTKKVLVVANDSYITATEVCAMLRKIAAAYGEKEVHLVLDNARYQKCQVVRDLAGQLGIHLDTAFQQKIDSIISDTDGNYKQNIDSLIGKGIQLFHDLVPIGKNTFATVAKGSPITT